MDVRTLLVVCADSDTGYRVVQLGRRADLTVVAVIRRRSDAGMFERHGADVVRANPVDRKDIAAIFANLNLDGLAVASIVGGTPQLNSEGNLNIINVANEIGVHRFVLVTSIGCGDSADAVDPFVKAFVGKALTAKTWAERALRQTDMDWTIVRAGGLLRRNFKGGAMLLDSKTVTGHINPTDLGDGVFQALISPKTVGRVLAAVDAEQAVDSTGEPLIAADL
jgi:uncharacterized protein YbjT (DUF2867 family)